MENRKFKTSIVNLKQLNDFDFAIPSYQRPYVWGEEQIDKLLTDFHRSFLLNENESYFIGTILTKEDQKEAELIDGQQRFTTLWLTAFVFWILDSKSEIENLIKKDNEKLRISFEIRNEVEEYLHSLIENKSVDFLENEKLEEFPYLENVAHSLKIIKGILEGEEVQKDFKAFGDYIYNNVHIVKNTTPDNIDLNKLFSTINSSGVQLEQTDIVKANLLKYVDNKVMFGKIWETCENMNNFFERNVFISFPKTDRNQVDLTKFISFNPEVFKYELDEEITSEEVDTFSIDNYSLDEVTPYISKIKTSGDERNRDSDEIICRSIINFGQLLLHTYRVHLKLEKKTDFEGSFHVNRLIEIFSTLTDKDEIERFIFRLWEIRFLFDKYIVKWITNNDTKEENLELPNYSRDSKGYYPRSTDSTSSSLMLQSLMYYTGDYLRQYWLTPYLYRIYKSYNNEVPFSETLLQDLELIDNQLSLSKIQDKEASFTLTESTLTRDIRIHDEIGGFKGTRYKHYWFQKLEYILWKKWEDKNEEKYKKYRIKSRNSIEHINPQNPKNPEERLSKEVLDSFGNLVLLNVAQNSQYGNKYVDVKKAEFNNKPEYDTLKSAVIFKTESYKSKEKIEEHYNQMLDKLKEHYDI